LQTLKYGGAGQHGDAGLFGSVAGRVLEAEDLHLLRRRADEDQCVCLALADKARILAEEAVAWMDGFGCVFPGDADDPVLVEIGLGDRTTAQVDGEVRLLDMQAVLVLLVVDHDGLDAESFQGTNDAGGDRATVGNKYSLEHGVS